MDGHDDRYIDGHNDSASAGGESFGAGMGCCIRRGRDGVSPAGITYPTWTGYSEKIKAENMIVSMSVCRGVSISERGMQGEGW